MLTQRSMGLLPTVHLPGEAKARFLSLPYCEARWHVAVPPVPVSEAEKKEYKCLYLHALLALVETTGDERRRGAESVASKVQELGPQQAILGRE